MIKLDTNGWTPGTYVANTAYCASSSCMGKPCGECMFSSFNQDEFKEWNVCVQEERTITNLLKNSNDMIFGEWVASKCAESASEFVKTPGELPGGSTPSQYRFPEGFREVQDLIEHRDMNFAIGNIFKACYRMHNCVHSDAIYDLNKILWFAQRELDRVSGVPEELC